VRKPTKILVLDVGGTHVKMRATGRRAGRQFDSGPAMTPQQMVKKVQAFSSGWRYDAVSIGYPGVVKRGQPSVEPHNLGRGWVRFNYETAFKKPVRIINDAALQALGSYQHGRMLFLGLGTGLGSALVIDGIIAPMELAHLPYKRGRSYEEYVGERGRKRLGTKKWRRAVADVVMRLGAAFEADDIVIGGGNARRVQRLPKNTRRVSNSNAFLGGVRLWQTGAA
jgi:polyphosphate glucokinase